MQDEASANVEAAASYPEDIIKITKSHDHSDSESSSVVSDSSRPHGL